MDLKTILNDVEISDDNLESNLKNNPNVNVHKKPIQLKDIERRSKTNHDKNNISETEINKLIDLEKGKIYNQSWNKLDNGSKINRLKKYSLILKEEHNLNENELNKLNKLLIASCNKNKLNKNSDVIYDIDDTEITNIKILEFNEDIRVFSLKINEAKSKPKNKSKTNIERFLK